MAVTLISVLLPILLIISFTIYLTLGRPIFFTQIRPGLGSKPFQLFKFRTMSNAKDENEELLPNELRMTKVGNFIRSTSLDELPELLNVIRGEMSLVGPRPLLMEYLPYYTEKQGRRHKVMPGITGWAQINGRNTLDWEQKLELDLWYVENQSLLLDLKILFITVYKVFKRADINHSEKEPMPRFDEYMREKESNM